MNSHLSLSRDEAASRLDSFVRKQNSVELQIQNRALFGENGWLSLGSVTTPHEPSNGETCEEVLPSRGHFLLSIYGESQIKKELAKIANLKIDDLHWPTVAQAIQDSLRRAQILPIIFDDAAISRLRSGRPCSVVIDTSAARQGAASFLVQNCQPFARLKVPPIITMELENTAQQFLSLDRAVAAGKPITPKMKFEMLSSQAGSQGPFRFLQKAQVNGAIIFEPILSQSDPLRSIFQPHADNELKQFNFSSVNRGFADRLILESAREHLRHYGRGLDVLLLTSDQGMARLALSEGIEVLYFTARQSHMPFGRNLGGVNYSLLDNGVRRATLQELLWELAISFGAARLKGASGDSFRVQCHPLAFPWTTGNARHDRLDLQIEEGNSQTPGGHRASNVTTGAPAEAKSDVVIEKESPSLTRRRKKPVTRFNENSRNQVGYAPRGYAFSVPKLIQLVGALAKGPLSRREAAQAIGQKIESSSLNYILFLKSIGVIGESGDKLELSPDGHNFFGALIGKHFDLIYDCLCRSGSFLNFMEYLLKETSPGRGWLSRAPLKEGAQAGYRDLAEMCNMLYVTKDTYYYTDVSPSLSDFSNMALSEFTAIADYDGYAESIQFLEQVAKCRIHPTVLRNLLRLSAQEGYLRISYQGAIPRVDSDGPQLTVLEVVDGLPQARRYRLQEGNFLSEEHASLRLKVEAFI